MDRVKQVLGLESDSESKRAALGTDFIPETHLGREDRNLSRAFQTHRISLR